MLSPFFVKIKLFPESLSLQYPDLVTKGSPRERLTNHQVEQQGCGEGVQLGPPGFGVQAFQILTMIFITTIIIATIIFIGLNGTFSACNAGCSMDSSGA